MSIVLPVTTSNYDDILKCHFPFFYYHGDCMLKKIYSVFDSKVEAFNTPFFLVSRGEALRSFGDVLSDKTSMIGKHPADYTLFELGTYDESCAKFDIYPTPISLGTALEMLPSGS